MLPSLTCRQISINVLTTSLSFKGLFKRLSEDDDDVCTDVWSDNMQMILWFMFLSYHQIWFIFAPSLFFTSLLNVFRVWCTTRLCMRSSSFYSYLSQDKCQTICRWCSDLCLHPVSSFYQLKLHHLSPSQMISGALALWLWSVITVQQLMITVYLLLKWASLHQSDSLQRNNPLEL